MAFGLMLAIAAVGFIGWILARAEANPPIGPPAHNTNVAPALLTTDPSGTAAGNVPSNGTGAGVHGVGVQESNIAPTETPGDGRVTTNPPVRAVASVDGVTLLRQSLRRGGLGSKALMTLTIRNRNDYPVKHLELFCSFGSPNGRYMTHRRHVIDGVVRPNSRRTFRHMMVGFVSINASRAKCSLLSADWA
ncbi:MAG: hypothetical protein ABI150_13470 [Nitrobacter sp.]